MCAILHLAKFLLWMKAIGGTIRSFSVDRWMQGTIVRGNPPSLKQDDVVSLVNNSFGFATSFFHGFLFQIARLDFRSASRGQLEPLLLDAHALGSKVQVIRVELYFLFCNVSCFNLFVAPSLPVDRNGLGYV